MKVSICGGHVFRLTMIAQGESSHGGVGTVVWNIFDDGETRSAVRAINKWI